VILFEESVFISGFTDSTGFMEIDGVSEVVLKRLLDHRSELHDDLFITDTVVVSIEIIKTRLDVFIPVDFGSLDVSEFHKRPYVKYAA